VKRSFLADPKPLNFLMTPESGLPVVPYNAEHEGYDGMKDEYLLSLI